MKSISQHVPGLRLRAAGLLALIALLTACTNDSGGPTEAEGLRLSGRVVATNSYPVAGVVVALAGSGAKDTTDAVGRFELRRLQKPSAASDTVIYTKNGQLLARVSVANWVDTTLPDVEVIQRDISGLLIGGGASIARVEGVVTGDGIDSAAPVTSEFYYNSLTGNYSGFVYFPPAPTVQHYEVKVKIYGVGDILIGSSQVVPFTSYAGNITVPAFAPGNARPVAHAGVDTAVTPGSTIRLHGTAMDSVGTITTWEWSIGGAPFVTASSGDTTFSRATQGAYACILRVTDNDGNQAVDTMVAAVLSQGVNWTARTSGTTNFLASVVWTGTQFVAVGSASTVVTSPDGVTWTTRLIDSANKNLNLTGVAWSGTKLIAAVGNGSQATYYTSSNGNVWAAGQTITPPLNNGANFISAADSMVFLASQGSLNRYFLSTSDHGATWGADTLAGGLTGNTGYLPLYAFTKHAGLYVGVGANGYTGSSVNGRTWTRRTDSQTFPAGPGGVYDYSMTSVVSVGSHAVAVGFAGHVMRSADGITWEKPRIVGNIPAQTAGSTVGDLSGVTWTGNALVAVGNGYTLVSADGGANWAQVQPGGGSLRSVAWNGTRLVAVGNSGTIVTSP